MLFLDEYYGVMPYTSGWTRVQSATINNLVQFDLCDEDGWTHVLAMRVWDPDGDLFAEIPLEFADIYFRTPQNPIQYTHIKWSHEDKLDKLAKTSKSAFNLWNQRYNDVWTEANQLAHDAVNAWAIDRWSPNWSKFYYCMRHPLGDLVRRAQR